MAYNNFNSYGAGMPYNPNNTVDNFQYMPASNFNNMHYVQNEQEARMFALSPGITEMWFKDLSLSNRIYRKYIKNGQILFETYSMELIPEVKETRMSSDYVTKDEVAVIVADAVRKELKQSRKVNKGGTHD